MSTLAVAKKDFQDAARSRLLGGLIVVLALFQVGIVYWFTQVAAGDQTPAMMDVIAPMITPTYILLPIIGTMLGYKSIVGERTSGSLKFLLGLPHSRRDVVLGKFVGRSVLVTLAVLIGSAVGAIALVVTTTGFEPVVFGGYVLATVLLGIVFVAVSVAFSSVTGSPSIATGGAISLVMLFLFLWDVVLMIVREIAIWAGMLDRLNPREMPPDWFQLLQTLNPRNAYSNVIMPLMDAEPMFDSVFGQDWFGVLVLGAWVLVMVGLAVFRFERVDL